jgi:hypothetical protein
MHSTSTRVRVATLSVQYFFEPKKKCTVHFGFVMKLKLLLSIDNSKKNVTSNVSCCLNFIYHAGAEDPRCPVLGLQEPVSRAAKAYEEVGSADKFMVTRT